MVGRRLRLRNSLINRLLHLLHTQYSKCGCGPFRLSGTLSAAMCHFFRRVTTLFHCAHAHLSPISSKAGAFGHTRLTVLHQHGSWRLLAQVRFRSVAVTTGMLSILATAWALRQRLWLATRHVKLSHNAGVGRAGVQLTITRHLQSSN